ncbi:ribosomal RNA small subunit methyltransferase RsmB [Thioflavicoccus mobilis 8321]|uniref:16S rRNA (cytosine(967)-C(5))-methyltransferase n=1 Tax=Thioflavicoccus mobilis 8321 TaxID=765912 RepID=L0GW38_9GAMM|nr:16S rRNA (cytosine(967)-C(5))-methyltransferase RsmB [Thioflavicoccus mobilis]AGA90042.1 ribosomal RNA small subunit methyltransferase RsmB [Thioflavicoccus mobilis 8321]
MTNALAERTGQAVPPTAGAEVRATAARVVQAVRSDGRSLTDALADLPAFTDGRDRALVQEVCFGTLRTLPRLEALSGLLMHRPLQAADQDIAALILVGLYQLAEMRVPVHAAVAATVAAARILGKPRAAGFVNALLRRYLREQASLEARAARQPGVDGLFPQWLQDKLARAWPEHWPAILDASNAPPPMTLRVNRMRTSRKAYAETLAAAGLTARPVAGAPAALMLDAPVPVARLPGFAAGLVSVQDSGAQLAAELLDAHPGERVLDACAAPGGKTAHLLERTANRIALTAIDMDPIRLARVHENLARLGLTAKAVVAADAGTLPQETTAEGSPPDWATQRYDRILLDVPCSATGVIRRHPDIKWLRRASDLRPLAGQQTRILDAVWPLLEPGGRLLYTTCSLLPEENEDQIAAFLARHPDAMEVPIEATWGLARRRGRQTLPTRRGPDGFYFALLGKAAA